jgi:uncharacterized protein CbrC (UPF0167 family)
MNWLRKMLGLCQHKWTVIRMVDIVGKRGDLPYATRYVLQCEHCGNLKERLL